MNIFARYMFSTKRSHKLALKILERYLKHAKDFGLVLNPNYDSCRVDAYLDADFDGIHGH